MLSDEEKQAIEFFEKSFKKKIPPYWYDDTIFNIEEKIKTILNIIEKQSKEIEELKEKNNPQPDCEEPIERTEEMVNMKWVNHNYILKTESEQKEKQAYIDGTNVADELCNKKWEDKIKAKVKEIKDRPVQDEFITATQGKLNTIIDMESLSEKE